MQHDFVFRIWAVGDQKAVVFEFVVFLLSVHDQTIASVRRIPVNAPQSNAHGGVLVILLLVRRVHHHVAAPNCTHVILFALIPGIASLGSSRSPSLNGEIVGKLCASGTRVLKRCQCKLRRRENNERQDDKYESSSHTELQGYGWTVSSFSPASCDFFFAWSSRFLISFKSRDVFPD